MATEFKLPDLGENIASGDVVTVFVSEGDVVKPGQPLLEVETDKAVIEVPSTWRLGREGVGQEGRYRQGW